MVVKIRLARLGCRNHPFYRVVVTDSKTARDGKQIEVLGFYNPVSGKDDDKRMRLKLERIKYWLSVGAQPSEPVERLLFRAGLGQQGGPFDKFPDASNQDQPTNAENVYLQKLYFLLAYKFEENSYHRFGESGWCCEHVTHSKGKNLIKFLHPVIILLFRLLVKFVFWNFCIVKMLTVAILPNLILAYVCMSDIVVYTPVEFYVSAILLDSGG
ncbi:30S ribosomal protein S16-1, chloroplastic, partial [Mucuna pruriens]